VQHIPKSDVALVCLTFAKFPFEKFVRTIVKDHIAEGENMKIGKDDYIITREKPPDNFYLTPLWIS
jgi:hypothetical protein